MPPLVVPNACQVVVEGQHLGRPWTSVYGVALDVGAPDLSEAGASALADLFDDYYEALEPLRATDWSMTSITVTDIRSTDGPQYVFPQTVVGTGIGEPMPPDMCIVHTWLTNRRGGSFRGRTYHNGFTEAGMDDGLLGPDERTAEALASTNFIGSFSGDFALGVISRTLLEVNVVNDVRVNNVFDRQLRRRFPQ